AYILKTQDFWVNGRIQLIADLHLPLSEGIVDPRYGFVGVRLVSDALRRQPLLFSLGMGGLQMPFPKLLKGLRWSMYLVPFFFRVVRPARFFRGLPLLRTSLMRRIALDILAFTGAGWLGTRVVQGVKAYQRRGARPSDTVVQAGFGEWADRTWETAHHQYELVANRDGKSLEVLYGGKEF